MPQRLDRHFHANPRTPRPSHSGRPSDGIGIAISAALLVAVRRSSSCRLRQPDACTGGPQGLGGADGAEEAVVEEPERSPAAPHDATLQRRR